LFARLKVRLNCLPQASAHTILFALAANNHIAVCRHVDSMWE